MITQFVGFYRSITDPEGRLDTAEKGRFEFALIINLRARPRDSPATPEATTSCATAHPQEPIRDMCAHNQLYRTSLSGKRTHTHSRGNLHRSLQTTYRCPTPFSRDRSSKG